jgi:hypothetical protein
MNIHHLHNNLVRLSPSPQPSASEPVSCYTFAKGLIDEDKKHILIDFSPKGGPKNLEGLWTGSGILFPDGNIWKKLE